MKEYGFGRHGIPGIFSRFYGMDYAGTGISHGGDGLIEVAFPGGSSRTAIEPTEKGHGVGDIVVMLRGELRQDERYAIRET